VGIPLALTAALFLLFAIVEWRRLPVVARIYLGAATAFAIGAFTYPGMSVEQVVDGTREGLTYVLAGARVAAFVAVLVSVATFLRERAFDA
jgi:flagellar biosynthesis protein FliR